MIEEIFDQFKMDPEKRRWITNAFEKCGQNPFMDKQQAAEIFTQHLSSLKDCSFYENIGRYLSLN